MEFLILAQSHCCLFFYTRIFISHFYSVSFLFPVNLVGIFVYCGIAVIRHHYGIACIAFVRHSPGFADLMCSLVS